VKYVLLFVDTEQFSNDLRAMSPAERDRAYERVHQWFADNARVIRGRKEATVAGYGHHGTTGWW
jgi:hypothetical protein